jgi:hypothetical protein
MKPSIPHGRNDPHHSSSRRMADLRLISTVWIIIALFMAAVWASQNMYFLLLCSSLPVIKVESQQQESSRRHQPVNTSNHTNQTQQTHQQSSVVMPKRHDNDDTTVLTVKKNSCVWGPTSSSQCSEMLRKRLTLPLSRLLFFGDSTIHNILKDGDLLQKKLVDDAMEHCPNSACILRSSEQCNRTYGLASKSMTFPPDELWLKGNLTMGEGPVSTGYINPGCSDCSNCDSRFLDCTAKETEKRCLVLHGGFVYTEFARDVVWQTPRYNTTQENTAHLLRDGAALYPNTACVMAAGYHDMEIPLNDIGRYIHNVNWYLSLYLDQHICQHVVWLANASPESDIYTQTIARTKAWNEAVQQELQRERKFVDSTTYVDLWNASQTWNHANNLHMDVPWNVHLTDLFVQLSF